MIIVKIELHSAREPGSVIELGRLRIANDGTGNKDIGHYDVSLFRKGTTDRIRKTGKVTGHRRGNYPIWVLVARAIKSVLSEANYKRVEEQPASKEPDEA